MQPLVNHSTLVTILPHSLLATPSNISSHPVTQISCSSTLDQNPLRLILRSPLDRLPDAQLRGIDRARDLLLPGGFTAVDQDLVNALLANDVSLGQIARCWSSCELASNETLERLKSRRPDSILLNRSTDSVLVHSLRFSASEEAVDGRSPLPSLGLRMVSGVFPASTVSRSFGRDGLASGNSL